MGASGMVIRRDDLAGPEIADLLVQHFAETVAPTPPESCHALDLEGLRAPDVAVWTIWEGDTLAGCGALKELDPTHGEIKSMHTADAFRRQGVGARMLTHLLDEARRRGYETVSLETGSYELFAAARALYRRYGFVECGPFGDYVDDPLSVFMTTRL